jgi:hypothetical protein
MTLHKTRTRMAWPQSNQVTLCSLHTETVCTDDAPSKRDSPAESVGWHLMLAQLIAVLRSCVPVEERDIFDAAHAGAHARRIALPDFFSYIIGKMRQYAPSLETNFREVFRIRNEARRKARSTNSSSSSLSSGSMNRSASTSSLSSAGDDEDLESKLQKLCVTHESALCGKRNGDDVMSESDVLNHRTRAVHNLHCISQVVKQPCC